MTNTYLDPYVFQRAASGHDTSTLIGNQCRLGTGVSAGATSLTPTLPTVTQINQYDQVYIFDGSASEIVTATAHIPPGSATLAVSATQYAHAAGVALCSDGSSFGSLAQCIIDACADLEGYCRQPLLQATYSNEELPLRSMRAAVTNDGRILIRPRRFPVTAVSALSVQMPGPTTLTLDVSQIQLDSDARVITVELVKPTSGSAQTWYSVQLDQTSPGFVQLSYTAGYLYSALPPDVRQAAIWLTSDLLSDRQNPTGAADIQLGKKHLVTRLRGDLTGESTLTLRAHTRLDRYRQRAM